MPPYVAGADDCCSDADNDDDERWAVLLTVILSTDTVYDRRKGSPAE